MKKLISAMLALSLCLPGIPSPLLSASTAVIMGTVTDTQGNPAAGVRIIARDPAAKVVGEAITNSNGQYVLQKLPQGHLQLTLNPGQIGFQGNNVVAYVGELGLTVNWTISQTAPAIAFASIGTASSFGANIAPVVAGLAIIGWSGSLMWGLTTRFDGDKPGSGSN